MAREYELNYRERITVWVWERMQAHFGERWARSYGPVWDAKREKARKQRPSLWPRMTRVAKYWADGLANIPQEAVARAVARVTEDERNEMPTWPEFLSLCRGDAVQLPARKAEPEPESEDQREARRERGAMALERVKGLLGSQSEKCA